MLRSWRVISFPRLHLVVLLRLNLDFPEAAITLGIFRRVPKAVLTAQFTRDLPEGIADFVWVVHINHSAASRLCKLSHLARAGRSVLRIVKQEYVANCV